MRYISNDGKVFDTDWQCYEYEQKIKKEERMENERKNMLDVINKKCEELLKLNQELIKMLSE